MKYMVKGIVWIVLITIGLLLGPPLLIGFVWWKVLIFGIACYLIGHGANTIILNSYNNKKPGRRQSVKTICAPVFLWVLF